MIQTSIPFLRRDQMISIICHTTAHENQRYPTLGDWFEQEGTLQIRASRVNNHDYEALIFLHELVESLLCRKRGISEADVDAFDTQFEDTRPAGDESSPGDSTKAPYYKEHQFATCVERLMAHELGVDWNDYERDLNKFLEEREVRF